jgi:hypothetical protein
MSELEKLTAEIQRLADIEAIKQLKAKYVRLADAQEWTAWGELFTDDVHLHTDGGPVDGRAAVVEAISGSLKGAKTMHRLHTPEIAITGENTATGKWPMSDYVIGTFRGQSMTIRGYGYYHEDYLRTANGWRLKRSQLVRQHVDTAAREQAPAI